MADISRSTSDVSSDSTNAAGVRAASSENAAPGHWTAEEAKAHLQRMYDQENQRHSRVPDLRDGISRSGTNAMTPTPSGRSNDGPPGASPSSSSSPVSYRSGITASAVVPGHLNLTPVEAKARLQQQYDRESQQSSPTTTSRGRAPTSAVTGTRSSLGDGSNMEGAGAPPTSSPSRTGVLTSPVATVPGHLTAAEAKARLQRQYDQETQRYTSPVSAAIPGHWTAEEAKARLQQQYDRERPQNNHALSDTSASPHVLSRGQFSPTVHYPRVADEDSSGVVGGTAGSSTTSHGRLYEPNNPEVGANQSMPMRTQGSAFPATPRPGLS